MLAKYQTKLLTCIKNNIKFASTYIHKHICITQCSVHQKKTIIIVRVVDDGDVDSVGSVVSGVVGGVVGSVVVVTADDVM